MPLDVLAAALTLVAFLVAIALAVAGWTRWWAVAGFLFFSSANACYEVIAGRLARRRARRLRAKPIPWNTPLDRPRWYLETVWFSWVGLTLGALAAALGFPGVGVGLTLALVGLMVFAVVAGRRVQPTQLTFEPRGLRVSTGDLSFVLPWPAITDVEPLGVESIWMRVGPPEAVVASVRPDTEKTRRQVRTLLSFTIGIDARLMLGSWAGGLDSETLTRAIEEAKAGVREQPN